MPFVNRLKTATLAAAVAIGATGFAGKPAMADHHGSHGQAESNIVQTAMGTGVHETLVTAVKAADLVDTLSGPGPFTVFAPTDTAFAKLPDGTVASLVMPANKDQLTDILTYHVIAGNVSSADLAALVRRHGGSASIETLAGEELSARLSGDTIVITDGAGRSTAVTQADVRTSNGTIHVTDGVFLPG
ncbi:fasciclin domain-containing protein [Qipengyuania sp. JC766]|uniref:fasciclin domain-containing protein n=1 Tax=Qipengyuania sp. JC766 TaxID=3232139 RepID=UPI00345981FE